MRRAAVLIALALATSAAGAQSVKVGERAPKIDLATVAGGKARLSELRGHPVVVTFWATWCPSCRTEFPDLVKVHADYSAAGLRVLAVNGIDQEHSRSQIGTEHVKQFIKEFSVPFPVALDKGSRVLRAYGILTLPAMVFIDSGGVVRAISAGPTSREALDRGIATILPPG
jgi:peroxiredoxin